MLPAGSPLASTSPLLDSQLVKNNGLRKHARPAVAASSPASPPEAATATDRDSARAPAGRCKRSVYMYHPVSGPAAYLISRQSTAPQLSDQKQSSAPLLCGTAQAPEDWTGRATTGWP